MLLAIRRGIDPASDYLMQELCQLLQTFNFKDLKGNML